MKKKDARSDESFGFKGFWSSVACGTLNGDVDLLDKLRLQHWNAIHQPEWPHGWKEAPLSLSDRLDLDAFNEVEEVDPFATWFPTSTILTTRSELQRLVDSWIEA